MADEIMSDLNVSETLKKKTILQCRKRKYTSITKILIPAACVLLTIGYINLSGGLSFKSQTRSPQNSELNALVDENADTLISAAGVEIDRAGSAIFEEANGMKSLKGMEEAKQLFGSDLLIPSYIPTDYSLSKIVGGQDDEKQINRIIITYVSGERSIVLEEYRTNSSQDTSGYDVITLDGSSAYLLPPQIGDGNEGTDTYTQLLWYRDGIAYTISGQITKEEIIKVWKGMLVESGN